MSDTATTTPEPTKLTEGASAGPFELNENLRTYHYGDGEVRELKVAGVRELTVSASGNHRLTLSTGDLVIVAPGWRAIHIDNRGEGWDV